jgi:serine/threonine protein kinase
VYECERQDGMRFAVKVFNISANAPSSGQEEEETIYARKCYHRELDFLRSLSHPHLIAFEDSTVREGVPYVIIEKMSCTLLEVQMDRATQAPFGQLSPIELNARIVSSHLLDGLAYLHSQHIVSLGLSRAFDSPSSLSVCLSFSSSPLPRSTEISSLRTFSSISRPEALLRNLVTLALR